MFWLVLIPFILVSVIMTFVILLQEPKQSGLGGLDGGGGGGGGMDFGSSGGTSGGLRRTTTYLAIIWGLLALALQVVPR